MHCGPLIGPRNQSVDEVLSRIPASATLRDLWSRTRCLAVVGSAGP